MSQLSVFHHRRDFRRRTKGISLLEIIVALAVLAGSAAMLSQMVDLGSRHADRAMTIADAQTVAHNVLHELLTGQRPLVAAETPEPVDLWSPWDVAIELNQVGIGQLVAVTIRITPGVRDESTNVPNAELGHNGSLGTAGDPLVGHDAMDSVQRPPTFRLTRWMSVETGNASLSAPKDAFERAESF